MTNATLMLFFYSYFSPISESKQHFVFYLHVTLEQYFINPRGWKRHRRTSQGADGLQPPGSGKAIIFWANAKFLGRSQQPKMKKKYLLSLHEKTEFVPSSEMKWRNAGHLLLLPGVSRAKQFCTLATAVFFRVLSKYFFGQRRNIKCMRIFAGVPLCGGLKWAGVVDDGNFWRFEWLLLRKLQR